MSGPADASVTVVIPTYNRSDLLLRTLETVSGQTVKPDEVIVVDDGSSDDTLDQLAELEVSVVRNSSGVPWGPARAREVGFRRTSTDLVAFIDSDDLMLPDALAQLGHLLLLHPEAPFAFGQSLLAHEVAGEWRPSGLMTATDVELSEPLLSLFARNFVPSAGTLARTADVKRIGGYPTATTWAEDHYFWIRLAELGDPVFLPRVTSVYRVHPGNRHTAVHASTDLGQFVDLIDANPQLRPGRPERLGINLCETVTEAVAAREFRAAAASIHKGLLSQPEKASILRRALRHWRDRRAWRDAGLTIWDGDEGLRRWLERY